MIDLSASPLTVAPQLLGATVRANGVTVRLTEVEAYCGESDPGSHAFRGRTARNDTMFLGPGHLYVYFTYGMHHCMNIVCWPEGQAGGCLIRAGEVIAGEELARQRRPGVVRSRDLARGPANLTRSLAITRQADGSLIRVDGEVLAGDPEGSVGSLVVEPRWGQATSSSSPTRASSRGSDFVVVELNSGKGETSRFAMGPRVGVSGVGGDGEVYPWRFWIEADPTVSAYKRGGGSRTRHGQARTVSARDGRLNPQ